MELFGTTSVPAITLICYAIGRCAKKSVRIKDEHIPTICAGMGAILGFIGYYIMPEFPAGDTITAIAVGIASGFAATGVHQVAKQLSKNDTSN